MALHRLTAITIGVPDVAETLAHYTGFGLAPEPDGWLSTRDGGRQLRVVHSPAPRLIELAVGADGPDDLFAVSASLTELGLTPRHGARTVAVREPTTGVRTVVHVADRLAQTPGPALPRNGPGRIERNGRAPGVLRSRPVAPRKLGHVALGSTDYEAARAFFLDGLGFRLSDEIEAAGAFLRCSSDHHNVLVVDAPVSFLHHTGWQVEDVDEVGRGAQAVLDDHPERHVWGLGRHRAGSHVFWYVKDPAGNLCSYYADMDSIVDDQLWTPESLEEAEALHGWGPPPPPGFLAPPAFPAPRDPARAPMTGAHQPG